MAGVLEIPSSEGSGCAVAGRAALCRVWARRFGLPEVQCESSD